MRIKLAYPDRCSWWKLISDRARGSCNVDDESLKDIWFGCLLEEIVKEY
jgi:hypothetical protein